MNELSRNENYRDDVLMGFSPDIYEEKVMVDGMDNILNKTLDDVPNDPTVISIKNVTQTGFDLRIQEWNYLDGLSIESVSYIAMETGKHKLPNGIYVEAGIFKTSGTKDISFPGAFNQPPALVCCGITTENELDAVSNRIYNISNNGFDFELQEQETDKMTIMPSKPSPIAPGRLPSGKVDRINYQPIERMMAFELFFKISVTNICKSRYTLR